MRKFIYIIGISALFASCGNLDEDERFTYVKPAPVARCVLLEDYTGQRCPNCPKAVDVIDNLHEIYGDNVIAVGIHGGNLAIEPNPILVGLKTAEGEEYYRNVGSPSQPSGRINRKGNPSNIDTWQSLITSEIAKTAPISLELSVNYDEESRMVNVTTNATGIDGTVKGKLQLWLVEDNIVAPQLLPDNSFNAEYVHNHVFRAAINGTWGVDFNIAEGEKKAVSHTAVLSEEYKAENVYIVAFVYDDSGVMQAAKIKIKK